MEWKIFNSFVYNKREPPPASGPAMGTEVSLFLKHVCLSVSNRGIFVYNLMKLLQYSKIKWSINSTLYQL